MNKSIYHALWYNLTAEASTVESTLTYRIGAEEMSAETVEECKEMLMHLVNLKAARHEMESVYKSQYAAPTSQEATKAEADAQWEELLTKVNKIEAHLDPHASKRTDPPTHDELMERSTSYRESQGAMAMGTVVEVKEEFDEE